MRVGVRRGSPILISVECLWRHSHRLHSNDVPLPMVMLLLPVSECRGVPCDRGCIGESNEEKSSSCANTVQKTIIFITISLARPKVIARTCISHQSIIYWPARTLHMIVASTHPTPLFNVIQHSQVMLWHDQSPIYCIIGPPEIVRLIHIHRIPYFIDNSFPVKVDERKYYLVCFRHQDVGLTDVAMNVLSFCSSFMAFSILSKNLVVGGWS